MPTLTKDGVSVTTESPREIVTLRSQGFSEQPVAEESLGALTVKDLQQELAARQLPVTGKKAELVARLAEAAPDAATVDASTVADSTESAAPTN